MLIEKINCNTQKYIESFSKTIRKEYGQFFTSIPTARYMASKATARGYLKILDVGAGTGILTAALIERFLRCRIVKTIDVVLYENDPGVIPVLKENLELMRMACQKKNISFQAKILEQNFILANEGTWKDVAGSQYDIVISNPPYKKISKSAAESEAMSDIVYGQPNIYFLCMAMGLHLLKQGGDYIYIVPRSWTSGLYFKNFRKYLLTYLSIKNMHLFVSRDNVFDYESVLQETMIVSGSKKEKQSPFVTITTSNGTNDFNQITSLKVKSSVCITKDENRYVLLPINRSDVETLEKMSRFHGTMESTGYFFKTGQVVEFRNEKSIFAESGEGRIPLIRPCHLNGGVVRFPVVTAKKQYIQSNGKSCLYTDMHDMLLLKRFTSKEESRRLQPAILQSRDFREKQIALENHVNYLVKADGEMEQEELLGLMAVFSSDLWDKYYRILNGSTQVNAGEVNSMPVPDVESIKKIGRRVLEKIPYNEVIEEVLYGENC